LEDIRILPSLKSAGSKGSVRGQESEEKEAGDLSEVPDLSEMALRIKIRDKINIKISFADPATLRTAQLEEDRGSVWIRGETGNKGWNVQIGGTIKFSAEELNAVEIKDAEVLPAESPAQLNPREETE